MGQNRWNRRTCDRCWQVQPPKSSRPPVWSCSRPHARIVNGTVPWHIVWRASRAWLLLFILPVFPDLLSKARMQFFAHLLDSKIRPHNQTRRWRASSWATRWSCSGSFCRSAEPVLGPFACHPVSEETSYARLAVRFGTSPISPPFVQQLKLVRLRRALPWFVDEIDAGERWGAARQLHHSGQPGKYVRVESVVVWCVFIFKFMYVIRFWARETETWTELGREGEEWESCWFGCACIIARETGNSASVRCHLSNPPYFVDGCRGKAGGDGADAAD